MARMGKRLPAVPNRIPLRLWQRLLLLGYAALFGGVLPFICWGALGMPGHPHAGPHFVFLPPPQANPIANIFTNGNRTFETTGNMAMNAEAHKDSTHSQVSLLGCALADFGGIAQIGAHPLHADNLPAGQAYPSLLAVTMMLLVDLALALLALPANRNGFRQWLASCWPGMVELRIPTPPPRTEQLSPI